MYSIFGVDVISTEMLHISKPHDETISVCPREESPSVSLSTIRELYRTATGEKPREARATTDAKIDVTLELSLASYRRSNLDKGSRDQWL